MIFLKKASRAEITEMVRYYVSVGLSLERCYAIKKEVRPNTCPDFDFHNVNRVL